MISEEKFTEMLRAAFERAERERAQKNEKAKRK